MKPISVVIVSGKQDNKTIHSLVDLPAGSEVIVSTKQGLGFARNYGASKCKNDLMIQLDDDLQINPYLWSWVQSLNIGEFAMATVDNINPASRVFAIYLSDFNMAGRFDETLRYIFEDWEFFRKAIKQGLKFKTVPQNLYSHVDHVNRNKGEIKFKIQWECAKLWAKYPRYSDDIFGKRQPLYNAIMFFFEPVRRLEFNAFFVRFLGALYWIIALKF